MVLVYHGGLEHLKKEVSEIKEVVDRRYKEVLGEHNARKLQERVDRLLSPGCYFDTAGDFNEWFRGNQLEEGTSNKMMLFTPGGLKVDSNGHLENKKVPSAIAFYIAKEAFAHSGSSSFTDREVASYIHEYDHFVWYALQKVPIGLAANFLSIHLGSRSNPVNIFDYHRQVMEDEEMPFDKRIQNLKLAGFAHVINDSHEKANRILDKLILESIGIEVPLPWRHQPKSYKTLFHPPATMLQVVVDGDPFKGLDDQEVVRRFISWEEYFNPKMTIPYLDNMLDSLGEMKISRHSLQNLADRVEKDERARIKSQRHQRKKGRKGKKR